MEIANRQRKPKKIDVDKIEDRIVARHQSLKSWEDVVFEIINIILIIIF